MSRLLIAGWVLVAATTASARAADDEAALRERIERLEAENEALKDQVVKLRREIAELKSPDKPEPDKPATTKRTLSSFLAVDAVLKGEFRTLTVDGKPYDQSGDVTLTINERKGNTFKGTFQRKAPGVEETQTEVSGSITVDKVAIKSLSAPRPFTMSGQRRGEYLDLLFKGPTTTAKTKLKLE